MCVCLTELWESKLIRVSIGSLPQTCTTADLHPSVKALKRQHFKLFNYLTNTQHRRRAPKYFSLTLMNECLPEKIRRSRPEIECWYTSPNQLVSDTLGGAGQTSQNRTRMEMLCVYGMANGMRNVHLPVAQVTSGRPCHGTVWISPAFGIYRRKSNMLLKLFFKALFHYV